MFLGKYADDFVRKENERLTQSYPNFTGEDIVTAIRLNLATLQIDDLLFENQKIPIHYSSLDENELLGFDPGKKERPKCYRVCIPDAKRYLKNHVALCREILNPAKKRTCGAVSRKHLSLFLVGYAVHAVRRRIQHEKREVIHPFIPESKNIVSDSTVREAMANTETVLKRKNPDGTIPLTIFDALVVETNALMFLQDFKELEDGVSALPSILLMSAPPIPK
jgi:hypothetical protein